MRGGKQTLVCSRTVHSSTVVINSSKRMDSIRGINFLGALFLLILLRIEGIWQLTGYYLLFFYLWIYLIFLIQELRYVYKERVSFLKHFTSHWLILVGLVLPILTVIFNRYLFTISI